MRQKGVGLSVLGLFHVIALRLPSAVIVFIFCVIDQCQ
jgi:hypothetical protein